MCCKLMAYKEAICLIRRICVICVPIDILIALSMFIERKALTNFAKQEQIFN